jgi:hypothetical protein
MKRFELINGAMIETFDGKWVMYDDLSISHKSDYTKCTDELCELIHSCNSELTRKSIKNVIKKHFSVKLMR